MARYKGSWRFNNIHRREHGRSGTRTVEASSEAGAKDEIQMTVSRQLFNTTMMKDYVVVTDIEKVTSGF